MTENMEQQIGVIVIGRNEGNRLKRCLRSVLKQAEKVVYVDSGSTDGSVAFAQSQGIDVVELDLRVPFTAARARNAGFDHLILSYPDLKVVQFLDGDCELSDGWVRKAVQCLASDETVAIVSGRRKEKNPEISVYNTIIDIEWNTPVGEARAVLGDMCVKVDVLKKINGFSSNIIAAEDDDLCIRVRAAGYRIFRLDADMSMHDANITHLSQWFRRAKRGGHGFANIYALHGQGPDRYFRRELLRAFFWGALVPLSFFIFLLIEPRLSAVILLFYFVFVARTAVRRVKKGDSLKIASCYSILMFFGKIYEVLGALKYFQDRLLSRKHLLIEYK